MLAGAMKASMTNAAATLNALPVQMARLAGALQAKLEAEGGATAPADTAEPGTDTGPAGTPNDEPAAAAAADEDPSTEE
jgi:large subunit ribosomal protein L10